MPHRLKISGQLLFAGVLLAVAACTAQQPRAVPVNEEVPHGIVFIIGDGMGAAHVMLAKLLRGDDFRIGRMPQVGLVATWSADHRATDSAAAATAYATGVKTNNGYLALDANRRTLPTVVELAEDRGLATGLVTTAPFGDASPAAFAAHVNDRYATADIAGQIVSRGIDILVSGHSAWFESAGSPTVEGLARSAGYQPITTAQGLRTAGPGNVLAVLPSGPVDGDSPEVGLPALAEWALQRLENDPDGFFLLLEHEGTDTASHRNDRPALEANLRSLDQAVGVVLDFAAKRGDILVVFTGDHETGGLQIAGTWDTPEDTWGSNDHTGEAIPIFATGPGAARFAGFRDNTEIGRALHELVSRM